MAMAATRVAAIVVLTIFCATCYGVSAQADAPAPSAFAGCMDSLVNMSDCLTYVQDGSTLAKPDKGCCPELAGLVESHPVCLCQLLGTNVSESYGIKINLKKALKLPSVCGVKTPSPTLCSAAGVPIPGPVGAPTGSAEAKTPSETVAAPPSEGKNNEASKIAGSALPLIFGLAIVFLPTFF